eukprot:scaffold85006_cov63-Attheya_sp.AAC.3
MSSNLSLIKEIKEQILLSKNEEQRRSSCYTGSVKKCPSKLLRRVALLNSSIQVHCYVERFTNPISMQHQIKMHRNIPPEKTGVVATQPDIAPSWRSLIGKLHFLKRVSQPDVAALISTPDVSTFVAFPATPGSKKMREPINWDSDSYIITTVDNCCTTGITNDLKDFISPPKSVNRLVTCTGMGGQVQLTVKKGTVKWTIEDDDRKINVIILPGTLYAPKAPFRLPIESAWLKWACGLSRVIVPVSEEKKLFGLKEQALSIA